MIPFSDFASEWCEHTAREWIEIINRGENLSALNYTPRGQIYRVQQFLDAANSYTTIFTNHNKPSFNTLDVYTFINSSQKELLTYMDEQTKTIHRSKQIVWFILNADFLITDKIDFLSTLNHLSLFRKNWVHIYLFKKDITAPFYRKKLSHFSSLYQNILIKKPYNPNEVDDFVKALEKEFSVHLEDKVRQEIIAICGNKLWFVKEAVRYIAKTGDTKSIFTHDEMILRLKTTLDELDPWEKEAVKKILQNGSNFSEEEKHGIAYLQKINFLTKKDETYAITIPLVAQYATEYFHVGTQLQTNNNHEIFINELVVTHFFSRREQRMLEYFISQPNKIIIREDLAKCIWKETYLEHYSDWALDQLIKRLREKLLKLGVTKEIIITKKNQGYMYSI